MISTHWLFGFGPESEENLDRPSNNFDIAGVPQGKWFDGIFACYKNIIPSCALSFCCPCVLWGQVVVRSQIPLLIAVKNSSALFRGYSGYGFFVNSLLLSFLLFFIFLFTGIFVPNIAYQALGISVAIIIFMFILFVMGHVRTAFKMKYSIPSALPVSCEFFDMVLDAAVSVFCLPCATSQMARHVFQYQRWNPPPSRTKSNIFKDPYGIPPLEVMTTRYPMADRAGLVWLENAPLPNTESQQGSAHRPPHVLHRLQQQQDIEQGGGRGGGTYQQQHDSAAITTGETTEPIQIAYAESASASPHPHSPLLLYRPDGTLVTSSNNNNNN